MTAHIHGATQSDEAAVVALWRTCGLVEGNSDPVRDFRAVRARPTSDILAAFDADGMLIGSIAVGYDSNRGWLHYVSVAPGQRGQGLIGVEHDDEYHRAEQRHREQPREQPRLHRRRRLRPRRPSE